MATGGGSTGKVPPDNYDGTVRWIYDDNQKPTLTNAWDRLVCRPKAYELDIPGIESPKAPDKNEFLRKAREFNSKRQDIVVHFLARGVQWGWRYDKGLSAIALGEPIALADVLKMSVWIASRTDTTAWKRLPEDQKGKLKSKIKELENQLRNGSWKPTSGMYNSLETRDIDYLPTKTDCEMGLRELKRNNSRTDLTNDDLLNWLEDYFGKNGKLLKDNWRIITERNFDIWFG
jgi:hypothetical protein